MLKSIALVGFFFFASAFSSQAGARQAPPSGRSKVEAPTAPAPQGFCPKGAIPTC